MPGKVERTCDEVQYKPGTHTIMAGVAWMGTAGALSLGG